MEKDILDCDSSKEAVNVAESGEQRKVARLIPSKGSSCF